MGLFGFKDVADAFDGGGAGKSGPTSSWEGTSFDTNKTNNYVAPKGTDPNAKKGEGLARLLSLVGLAASGGNPLGAAIGGGLGSLLTGGGLKGAFQSGVGNYALGATTGPIGLALDTLSGGKGVQQAGSGVLDMFGMGGGENATVGTDGKPIPGQLNTGINGLLKVFDNPLMMALMLKATEPKNVSLLSGDEKKMMKTGERNPGYQGTPAFDYTYSNTNFAKGGFIAGPGTGTSDSIPARIYQHGKPTEEARLSDGEFVMTNRAVRGAGGGDRARGAAEMYRLMRQFERRS